MLNPLLVASILGVSVGFQPSVNQQLVVPETGQTKLKIGLLSEPLAGELTQSAKAWALNQRQSLGLPANSTLRNGLSHGTWFGASFRLHQQIDGIDVYGAQAVVTIDAQRRVTILSSSILKYERSVMSWTIGADEALARASKAVPMALLKQDGKPYGGARREIFGVGIDAHAGYLAMVPTADLTKNWWVAIDAVTGEVLWKQNRVHTLADDAQVYNPSPGGLDAGVGATATIPASLTHADGGSMVLADAGGYLEGSQLTAYNCCPNEGCRTDADAGPKRRTGMVNLMGFNITYDVPVCDRVQRATNDVLVNDGGSYVYLPIDPPSSSGGVVGPVTQADLAHSDHFAEVHSFYQINAVYDWVRGLSAKAIPLFPNNVPTLTPFKMRDELRTPARKPAVWANVTFPDIEGIQANPQAYCNFTTFKCTIDKLGRIDNAAFMPKENFSQIPIADYQLDVDTLLIFQGNRADFAYDAPVLWHEFGHGAVYATAALTFDTLAVDTRSANNESGAMHEAFADYIAGAFGNVADIGTYVGPRIGGTSRVQGVRQDSYLRTMDNTLTCPDVLWGEVHQDSQHLSAALWSARKTLFQGTDSGKTFDAAFYASLVSMAPNSDFASSAAIIVAHVKSAFSTMADAETKMQAVFTAKGVVGCSKVLDMTSMLSTARPYYGISAAGTSFAAGTVVPGPYQMKINVPLGMKTLSLSAKGGSANPLGGGAPQVKLLAKAGQPITFTKIGSALNNNADKIVDAAVANGVVTAMVALDIGCGATSEVYLTLGSTQGDALQDVKVSFAPADTCNPVVDAGVDAGTPDAGSGDGGSEVKQVPWIGKTDPGTAAPKGCGCSGVEAGFGGLAALVLLAIRRRRHS